MTRVVEGQTVVTPTNRQFFRRARFWIIAALFVIAVALVQLIATSPSFDTGRLAPDGTGTVGSQALLRVLQQQGVNVVSTSTLKQTRRAITSSAKTTLLVYDTGYLNDSQLRQLPALAARVILVDPGFDQLKALAPSLRSAGKAKTTLHVDCSIAAVRKAGTVADGGVSYRAIDPAAGSIECLGSGNGAYSLVQLPTANGTLTVLGTSDALTNQHIIDKGNAALSLNLLGALPNLVWYLPSIDDESTAGSVPTFAQESPAWVIPTMTLALLVVIAAAVWRGRRFGPLVVEKLPVIVPASETMEGRARLYQKSSARLRALDALRVGSIQRLAKACGLPRLATSDEVIAAVASVTSRDLAGIRSLLLAAVPRTDRELVSLSDDLVLLERAVETATRPA